MANLVAVLITAMIVGPIVVPIASHAVLGAMPGVHLAVINGLVRLGHQGMEWRTLAPASIASWMLRKLCPSGEAVMFGHMIRAQVAADRGHTRKAVKSTEEMLGTLRLVDQPERFIWTILNAAIDVFVNAGHYQTAAELPDEWSGEATQAGREQLPAMYAIAQINRAEALHNLGRNEEALALLNEVEGDCRDEAVAVQGRAVLLAWILAHVNRVDEAEDVFDAADPTPLGRYRSEFLFTQSLLARQRGEVEAAIKAGLLGLKLARRASSRRNGLVVVAAAELARGEHVVALQLLRRAARQRYRGQSAVGLLLLGNCYQREGREADARKSYTRALEQDPESWVCGEIRERLKWLEDEARAV